MSGLILSDILHLKRQQNYICLSRHFMQQLELFPAAESI